jgi:hypothetical protein
MANANLSTLKIVARIPQDNGKIIRCYSGDSGFTVAPTCCEGCDGDRMATVVVKGEEDSFGWEPVFWCDVCAGIGDAENKAYTDALDVEDRQGYFYVAECTNYDGHGNWDMTFTSYRQAVAYLRKIEVRAGRWGGLYPNKGVRETDAKGLEDFKARVAEEHRREIEFEMDWPEEEDDEDDDRDIGWPEPEEDDDE